MGLCITKRCKPGLGVYTRKKGAELHPGAWALVKSPIPNMLLVREV